MEDILTLCQNMVRPSTMEIYGLDAATADYYFRNLWLGCYAFMVMVATGTCPYTDQEIKSIFTQMSLANIKAIKEIEGFTTGTFDVNATFRSIVKPEEKTY